jgi:predicted aspartyl protease
MAGSATWSGDHRLSSLIDTGADRTAIHVSVLREQNVAQIGTIELQTPDGTVAVEEYEKLEIRSAGGTSRSLRPIGMDVKGTLPGFYLPFDNVLGFDYLQHQIVTVSDGRVRIHSELPAVFGSPEFLVQRQSAKDVLNLDVEIPGLPSGRIRIDTGATGELRVNRIFLQRLQAQHLCVEVASEFSFTASGRTRVKVYILREIRIAGVHFRNVPITVAENNAIELGILRHLNLALDFPNKCICIGKLAKSEISRFPINASGMAAAFNEKERLMVRALRPDSPATTVGIEVGDEVLMIEGTDIERLSIDDVEALFAQDGKTIEIQLRRGMQVRTVNLALKLPFEYPPNWEAMDAKVEGFEKFLEAEEKTSKSRAK